MENEYHYNYNKKNYVFNFITEKRENNIIIELKIKNQDKSYNSKYDLKFLNSKLSKKKKFSNIEQFKECLINNINTYNLIIKDIYEEVIFTIWKIFPTDRSKEDSYTLIMDKISDKDLSLIFYSNYKDAETIVKKIEKDLKIAINENINKPNSQECIYKNNYIQNMIFLKDDKNIDIFKEIIKEHFKYKQYRTIIFFFDNNDANFIHNILLIIHEFYSENIFLMIYTNQGIDEFRAFLEKELNGEINNEEKKYFDLNNIIILNEKSDISISSIYRYYNQIGDGYLKEVYELDKSKELEYLRYSHYFNIMLFGCSGVGKSTFINTILGEKRAFEDSGKSSVTYRNNYYVHKKYPIKLIDCFGSSGKKEGEANNELLNSIYDNNHSDILIDKYSYDIYDNYNDKRNTIHLLLYFNCYGGTDKYDINGEDEKMMKNAKEKKKIPIIFIINKCEESLFSSQRVREKFEESIKKIRKKKNPDFVDCNTFLINCKDKNGFDKLLTYIYDNYKIYITSNENLQYLKNGSIKKKDIKNIFINSKIMKDIDPEEFLLNKAVKTSVLEIKKLIIKIAGNYLKELNLDWYIKFGFYFQRLYDNFINVFHKNNYFPLLTDLVKTLFNNFNQKEKTIEDCSKYIREQLIDFLIAENTNIDLKINNLIIDENKQDNFINENVANNIQKFSKIFKSLTELFLNISDNFNIEDDFEKHLYLSKN